jgi:hypothetical protein
MITSYSPAFTAISSVKLLARPSASAVSSAPYLGAQAQILVTEAAVEAPAHGAVAVGLAVTYVRVGAGVDVLEVHVTHRLQIFGREFLHRLLAQGTQAGYHAIHVQIGIGLAGAIGVAAAIHALRRLRRAGAADRRPEVERIEVARRLCRQLQGGRDVPVCDVVARARGQFRSFDDHRDGATPELALRPVQPFDQFRMCRQERIDRVQGGRPHPEQGVGGRLLARHQQHALARPAVGRSCRVRGLHRAAA